MERALLYRSVLEQRPTIALEVGTWKGGGSTLQITTALQDLNHGHLYTCEVDPAFYKQAVASYEASPLAKYVTFHQLPSTDLIKKLFESRLVPSFVFFDGPEDALLNLNDFKLLEERLELGACFCMHDWDLGIRPDGMQSQKAELLRPYLEQSARWQILTTLTAPVSVGMVVAKKIK
jgi:predicted O-methyltransferase YrrM